MFFKQKPSTWSDSDLILKFKETGDLAFVSELFTRYTSMTYGVCLKYLRDRDEAKDAVMQVFEKLPGSLKVHEVVNFKSWLYVTVRNLCLMQIRSKRGKFTEDLSQASVESAFLLHPTEEPELEGDLNRMEKCIEELAAEQKECVRLFFLQEKCYKEITETTGFEMSKVKSYIQNGKRNLKICMERNG